MPKVYLKTYGCQMNERDTEQVARMFTEGGYTLTPTEKDADAILINTCSVRDQAEQKALGKMGIMARSGRSARMWCMVSWGAWHNPAGRNFSTVFRISMWWWAPRNITRFSSMWTGF